MQLSYGQLKDRSAAVAAAMAAERSARNLASRRRAEDVRDEREANHYRRRRKRKEAEELKALHQRLRVRMPQEERPRIGTSTARKLFHRTADMLVGTAGTTDARGPDGLYSIHFAFIARGFASTKGRRWRNGEAERAALYIVREDALEGGECGWWSNIAANRNELAAYYRTSEAIERHDRSNANVYIAEIIALPHELSARQRRKAVRRICRFFDQRGLPYTAALHLPDRAGDQRNYHVHIIYSLRPCERHGAYDWSFAFGKEADINTPAGIKARRIAVVKAINKTLSAARIDKRYTHLSNKARGMAAGQAKIGQEATWMARRLEALEKRVEQLQQLSAIARRVRHVISITGLALQRERSVAAERLHDIRRTSAVVPADLQMIDLESAVHARLALQASTAQNAIATYEKRVEAIGNQTAHATRREKLLGLRQLILAAALSLRISQIAKDEHLRGIANRVRRTFSESSERHMQLVNLSATAEKLEKTAHLMEWSSAIHQKSTVFDGAIDDTRNAVAKSMLAKNEAIERRTREGFSRLENIHRASERIAATDRLNGLAANLEDITAGAISRMLGAGQRVSNRLNRIRPDTSTAVTLAQVLASLGEVAQRHHRDQQLSELAITVKQVIASADRRLNALHQRAAMLDHGIDPVIPVPLPRTVPVPTNETRGDSDRRKAIAAAAWQFRRTPFPPQVRTATGFAIAQGFTSQHIDVDRFEAEAIIQRIHARKWAAMLTALKRHVEKSARSPFVAGEGRPKLDPYGLDMRLRDAYWAAYPSRDMQTLLEGLRRDWQVREAAKRREQKKVEQAKAAADAKLRERVDRIIARAETLVEQGKWPGANDMTLAAVGVIAKAIIKGQFAMRMVGSDVHIYCESEALRSIAGKLEASPTGRNALVALGKLTADRPIDRKALPLAWTLPLPRAARSTESPPEPSRPGPSRGRGGHER